MITIIVPHLRLRWLFIYLTVSIITIWSIAYGVTLKPSIRDMINNEHITKILLETHDLNEECDLLFKENQLLVNEIYELDEIHIQNDITFRIPAICLLLKGLEIDDTDINSSSYNHLRPSITDWTISNDYISDDNNSFSSLISSSDKPVKYISGANQALQLLEAQFMDLEKLALHEKNKYNKKNPKKKLHASQLSPIILVPGFMGSRLQDKLDKPETKHWYCRHRSDWQDGFWLDIENFLPFVSNCWLDNMRMVYDPESGFAKCPEGVQVRAYPFGSVESVSNLQPVFQEMSKYMANLIEKAESIGYKRDVNILAAPYDFRLAPQQLSDYFNDLTRLVESAKNGNGYDNKVTLICHSMGCKILHYFLNIRSSDWRSKHILKVVAIAAPWGGSFQAIQQLVVGKAEMIPMITDDQLRQLFRTFPSSAFLLPDPRVFGDQQVGEISKQPFVITPERNYSIHQVSDLLDDIGLHHQSNWYKRMITDLNNPSTWIEDVKLVCVHGTNMATPRQLRFTSQIEFPDGEYEILWSDGDSTVNWESLAICKRWARDLGKRVVQNIEIFNTDHLGALRNGAILSIIEKEVLLATGELLSKS